MEYFEVNYHKEPFWPHKGETHKKPVLLALKDNTEEKNKDLKVGSLCCSTVDGWLPACLLFFTWASASMGRNPPRAMVPATLPCCNPSREDAGPDQTQAIKASPQAGRLHPGPGARQPWGRVLEEQDMYGLATHALWFLLPREGASWPEV